MKAGIKNKYLIVLVDFGRTHSFIDAHKMKEVGPISTYTPPIRVTATDDNYICCDSHCMGMTWTMQGKTFKEYLGIISLGGCDIILGND